MDTETVVITDPLGAQTLSAAQTLCTGSTPAALSGANPTGGTGVFAYQWQSSADDIIWVSMPADTLQNFGPGALTTTTYYRRVVSSGLCPANTSGSLMITIEPLLGQNTITTAQTICAGDLSQTLSGSIPTGGNGVYLYQWQSSANNSTFAMLTGANLQDYAAGSLMTTTYYRRIVTAGVCPSDTTAGLNISVNPVITQNTIGNTQTICAGSAPLPFTGLLPLGGDGTYAYQWESSSDNITYTSVVGANLQNYTEGTLTATAYYRRVITSGACSSTSAEIRVWVEQGLAGNTVIADQTLCSGTAAAVLSGGTMTGGTGLYTYQWESSNNNISFLPISLATGVDYSPGIQSSSVYYRRSVSSGVCSGVTSNSVVLVIEPVLTNNTVTGNQTICALQTGAQLSGSVPLGGIGIYSYQWESSSDNVSWSSLPGETLQHHTPNNLFTTTYFRRVVSSGVCPAISSGSVVVQILPQLLGNVLSANQTICTGSAPNALSGQLPSGGTGIYSYQWEVSPDNSSWSNIGGAVSQNYGVPVLTSDRYYRRTLTSGPCVDVSNVIHIRVEDLLGSNSIGNAQTICTGTAPQQLTGTAPTGGSGSYQYAWESSTNTVSWAVLPGEVNATLNPPVLNASIWYRRIVSSGVCASHTSSGIQVRVDPIPTASISGNHTVCTGTTVPLSIQLTGTAPWNVIWTDGVNSQTINGIMSSPFTLNVVAITTSTYTLTNVFSVCAGTLSGQGTVTVNSVPTAT